MKKHLLSFALFFVLFTQAIAQQDTTVLTGMTSGGGSSGMGTAYNYNATSGADSLLFSFGNNLKTIFLGKPCANLVKANNGVFYGLAATGGENNYGGIFSYNPVTGNDSIIISFTSATGAGYTSFIKASNGILYGMTRFGSSNTGYLISFNPATNKDSILASETIAAIMQASNGLIYGITSMGGTANKGAIFTYNPANGQSKLVYSFTTTSGYNPNGALLQATNGILYGMTNLGGKYNVGTMFSFDPVAVKDSVLINFDTLIGMRPQGGLIQATNGLIYGLTYAGGPKYNGGAIFSYNINTGKDSVLINLATYNEVSPFGELFQASNGLMYGMTYSGGSSNIGTIFSFDPVTGVDSLLVSLTGQPTGDSPFGDIIEGNDGKLYGITSAGGSVGAGAIFKLNSSLKTDSIMLNFGCASYRTINNSVLASNGLIYGVTYAGGLYDQGTLFSYNSVTGKDTVLLSFNNTLGANPYGGLIQAKNGILYGLTFQPNYAGTIYSYDPVRHKDSLQHQFKYTDGGNPYANLVQATNGLLYGTTTGGGKNNYGVIFSFDPLTGKDSTLVNFNYTNGGYPYSTLCQAANGIMYGTTSQGGVYSVGVLFSYNITSGVYDTLTSMGYGTSNPQGSLIADTAMHELFFVSPNGGANYVGALCGYNYVKNKMDTLVSFNVTNGQNPTGIIVWDTTDNYIYGTTYTGGTYNYGVLYRYDMLTGKDTTLLDFHDSLSLAPPTAQHKARKYKGAVGTNPCGIIISKKKKAPPLSLVSNVQRLNTVLVYPNPISTEATVIFNNDEKHFIELNDMQGKRIKYISESGSHYILNKGELAPGLYMVSFYDAANKYMSSCKIVIE